MTQSLVKFKAKCQRESTVLRNPQRVTDASLLGKVKWGLIGKGILVNMKFVKQLLSAPVLQTCKKRTPPSLRVLTETFWRGIWDMRGRSSGHTSAFWPYALGYPRKFFKYSKSYFLLLSVSCSFNCAFDLHVFYFDVACDFSVHLF